MIILKATDFDTNDLSAAFARGLGDDAGAIVSFTGLVRREGDKSVKSLWLDHHPVMTKAAIEEAVECACARWKLIEVLVVHRVGEVAVGNAVVFVAVASVHRRDSYEACDFLMDYLKTDAPFWKKEITDEGAKWIEPRRQDLLDRARWKE